MPKNKFKYLSDSKRCCSTAGENFSHKSLVEQFFTLRKQRQRSSTCYSDRFLLAVESRYLSQADKSIIRVSIGTKFSDYLGLNHYKKAKKLKHFIHLRLAQRPQSLSTYHIVYHLQNSGHRLKKYVPVM